MSDKSITNTKNDSVVSTVSPTEHNQLPKQSNNSIKKSDHKSPSKSRVYKQAYRTAWESVPHFKGKNNSNLLFISFTYPLCTVVLREPRYTSQLSLVE